MKDTWKEYFLFNRRQRNGILVLLSLIAIMVVYLFVADYFPASGSLVDFTPFKSELGKVGMTNSLNTNGTTKNPHIDINSADTSLLMTLPKMTSYCASMIVRYRKKLGGYYSINQLKEVWGMDSNMYKALSNNVWADTGLIHKININAADAKELGYNPYVKYYLAKAIINYREEHGLFPSLSALHKMAAIDDSTYSRITPYMKIGNN